MEKLKILIVEPNKEPYQAKIEHSLEEMQRIVGGLIEFVELEYNVDLICNEEGKIDNLEMNRLITNDIICGTFFIAGQHNGKTISLNKKQLEKYKQIFNLKNHESIIKFFRNNILDSSCLLNLKLGGVEKLKQYIK